MITELLPCLFCGSEAGKNGYYGGTQYYRCSEAICPLHAIAATFQQWNRRFVCLDKNGEKVFAGDKVMIINTDGDVEEIQPITLNGQITFHNGSTYSIKDKDFDYGIELTESDGG